MGAESPNIIIYDVNGQAMSVSNGAAIPAGTSALMVAGSDGTNSRYITIDTSGNLITFLGIDFVVGAVWNSSTALNALQYQNGTTTIGQLNGAQVVIIQLDQTTTLTGGVVTFQGTFDKVNWVTVPAAQVLNPNTFVQIANPYTFVASTNQPFLIVTQGYIAIRMNLTTVITGTGSVTPYWSTSNISPQTLISGTVTANQGTANTLANAWTTEITDGTNGPVSVKPASTAVATADPSLAVGLSPNSPLPSGTNTIGSLVANQSVNIAEVGGNATVTGGVTGSLGVGGLAATGAAVSGHPVLVGGSDGTNARTFATDGNGHPIIVGFGAAGGPSGGVLSVQGVNGGTNLPVQAEGAAQTGSAVVGFPVLIAGWDGSNARTLLTDTSGRQEMIGAAAAGATAVGNPVLMGGTDGTNAQSMRTDTNGRTVVVGAANIGAVTVGAPVLTGGSDGTDVRAVLTDVVGRTIVAGAAASGSAALANPVLVGGSDGTDARTLATDTSGNQIIVGDGTAGSPAGGVVSVQGVASGTPITTEISDGTHGPVSVTAASTSAVATNPALVVSQTPNLPLTNTTTSVNINASTNGNNTLVAGVAGKTVRVFKVALVFSAGGTVIFQDGNSTALSGPFILNAGATIVLDMDITNPWFLTSSGNAFVINLSGGAVVGGVLYYTQS